jgi:hypothetical protein
MRKGALLGLNQSSLFRLAHTLERRGFLANPTTARHVRDAAAAITTALRVEPE